MSVVLYQAHHPVLASPGAQVARPYRVAGNLMQATDILAEEVPLCDPRPGDTLAIGMLGAYGSSRSTTFNERPRPAELLIARGAATLVRRAETAEDLFVRDLPLAPRRSGAPRVRSLLRRRTRRPPPAPMA